MPSTVKRIVVLVAVLLLMLVSTTSVAVAHTGFVDSDPIDGAVVTAPVTEITLLFSGEAAPAGEGFVILDASGTIREPDAVSDVDGLIWTLSFDESLPNGVVGVRWSVAAPDAHPIDGSFSFTIDVAASGSSATDTSAGVAPAVETTATDRDAVTDLDEFLAVGGDDAPGADTVMSIARTVGIAGAVVAIGGLAFAVFGLRTDDRNEIAGVVFWTRRAGIALSIAAVFEATGSVATLGGSWADLLSPSAVADALLTSTGVAILLRFAGGAWLASQTHLEMASADTTADPVALVAERIPIGAGGPPIRPDDLATNPLIRPGDHTWSPFAALVALPGAVAVIVSFMFDGHTVSEGPRWLHAIANATHVTAAAIWAGGVLMVATTIHRRRRRGVPARSLQLAARFSVVATAAVVAAGLAGVALAVIVLDGVSELWSTPWGRLLALKIVLVATAAAAGGYNHLVMVPELERHGDHPDVVERFRSTVMVEATLMIAIVITTAFLIGSSAV